MSKLSIIIATYNSEKTLQQTFDSIFQQTWKDYEVIVIDGNSKDKTKDIVSQNLANVSCFISEPDSGVYDAFNKGIAKSKSDWIYFIGSDDIFHDDKVLEDIFNLIDKENLDFVYGNVIFKNSKKIYDGKFYKIKMHFKNICQQSIFYKSYLFKKFGYFNLKYKLWSDYDFNMKCFGDTTVKKKYIDRVIAVYNDEGSSSSKEDEIFKQDRKILIKRYFGYSHYFIYGLRRLYQISKKKIKS